MKKSQIRTLYWKSYSKETAFKTIDTRKQSLNKNTCRKKGPLMKIRPNKQHFKITILNKKNTNVKIISLILLAVYFLYYAETVYDLFEPKRESQYIPMIQKNFQFADFGTVREPSKFSRNWRCRKYLHSKILFEKWNPWQSSSKHFEESSWFKELGRRLIRIRLDGFDNDEEPVVTTENTEVIQSKITKIIKPFKKNHFIHPKSYQLPNLAENQCADDSHNDGDIYSFHYANPLSSKK